MKLDCQSIKLFINTDLSDTEKCNGRSCFYCLKFILGSQPVIDELDFFFYGVCFLYDCSELPHTEVFKLKHLLLTAEIFLNAPSGKVSQGDIYHVFFGFDFLIGCKHHGMFRNAVNQYEINIFL